MHPAPIGADPDGAAGCRGSAVGRPTCILRRRPANAAIPSPALAARVATLTGRGRSRARQPPVDGESALGKSLVRASAGLHRGRDLGDGGFQPPQEATGALSRIAVPPGRLNHAGEIAVCLGSGGSHVRAWKTEIALLAAVPGLQPSVAHRRTGHPQRSQITHRRPSPVNRELAAQTDPDPPDHGRPHQQPQRDHWAGPYPSGTQILRPGHCPSPPVPWLARRLELHPEPVGSRWPLVIAVRKTP